MKVTLGLSKRQRYNMQASTTFRLVNRESQLWHHFF